MGYLKLNNLTKKYGDFTAVSNINIDLEKGEMVALLGGSGCGKTTILRMIAGFIEPNEQNTGIQKKRGYFFPELCAVSPYDGFRQRSFQPEAEKTAER